ncbi:hypothetical protein HPP92_010966 [Vanilla planifolia]|uniref:Uncharacterized protein n=1 Tax=Vanilla planifolia TaxID=51239 RepID=A0A835RAI0_VANPL|nr:hypothetical protein HPP92_010966 [Vanilla planifolia]
MSCSSSNPNPGAPLHEGHQIHPHPVKDAPIQAPGVGIVEEAPNRHHPAGTQTAIAVHLFEYPPAAYLPLPVRAFREKKKRLGEREPVEDVECRPAVLLLSPRQNRVHRSPAGQGALGESTAQAAAEASCNQ